MRALPDCRRGWIQCITWVLLGGFVLPSCATAYLWEGPSRGYVQDQRRDGELLAAVPPVGDDVGFFVPVRLLPPDSLPHGRTGMAGLMVRPQAHQAEIAATLRSLAAGIGTAPRCGITLADGDNRGEGDGALTAKLHFDWVEDERLQLSQIGFDADATCAIVTAEPAGAMRIDGAVRVEGYYHTTSGWERWALTPVTVVVDVVTLPVQAVVVLFFAAIF